MDNRGIKLYAVMAHKPGWTKPRFVWDNDYTKHLFTFESKRAAVEQAKSMNDDKQIGGKKYFCLGWTGSGKNRPKLVEVDWIVCEVWCEMTGKVLKSNSKRARVTRVKKGSSNRDIAKDQ